MSDALSYVYRGREGTGVAQVLKQPTPVAPPKPDTSFLDSMGNDIRNGGTVWEVDRPEIMKARNELVDLMSKVYASGKDPKRDPEIAKMLLDGMQLYKDKIAKSQLDQKGYYQYNTKIQNAPDIYTPESKDALELWRESGINREIEPAGVKRYSALDYTKPFKTPENYYTVIKKKGTRKDGSSFDYTENVFDQKAAETDWDTKYAPLLANNKEYQGAFKAAYNDLADEMGDQFNSLPEDQKGIITNQRLKDIFVSTKRNQKLTESTGAKAAPIDKTKETETTSGKGGYDIDKDIALSWELTGNDNMVKRVDFNLTPIPNPKKKIAEDGALDWNDANKRVIRSPLVQVRVRENGKPFVVVKEKKEIKDKYNVVVETKEQEVELPLTTNNKNNLRDYYNFDADKEITSPDAKWRVKLDKFTDPKAEDFNLSQERFDIILNKRKGNAPKATPAPKAKTTNTKIDPQDEQFFRK